jgi:hypothetical protein
MTVADRLCGHLGLLVGPLAISSGTDDGPTIVREYRSGDFTGAGFDTYGIERFDLCAITGDDLIAVSMLSIGVSTRQTGDLAPDAILKIERNAGEVRGLLEALPSDRDLHSLNESEFENLIGPGSPGDELYLLLRRTVGFPRVATHKLMARKRPRLAPVRDSVTAGMLGLSTSLLGGDPGGTHSRPSRASLTGWHRSGSHPMQLTFRSFASRTSCFG